MQIQNANNGSPNATVNNEEGFHLPQYNSFSKLDDQICPVTLPFKENGIVTMEIESDVAVEVIESKVAELKVNVDDNKDNSKSTVVLEKDVPKVIEKGAATDDLKTLSIATDKKSTKIVNLEEEKRGKPRKVGDPETQAMARKDDISRVPINYKKALLEGIQGKVNVPDQAIGA